jgi:hypothetical protein
MKNSNFINSVQFILSKTQAKTGTLVATSQILRRFSVSLIYLSKMVTFINVVIHNDKCHQTTEVTWKIPLLTLDNLCPSLHTFTAASYPLWSCPSMVQLWSSFFIFMSTISVRNEIKRANSGSISPSITLVLFLKHEYWNEWISIFALIPRYVPRYGTWLFSWLGKDVPVLKYYAIQTHGEWRYGSTYS